MEGDAIIFRTEGDRSRSFLEWNTTRTHAKSEPCVVIKHLARLTPAIGASDATDDYHRILPANDRPGRPLGISGDKARDLGLVLANEERKRACALEMSLQASWLQRSSQRPRRLQRCHASAKKLSASSAKPYSGKIVMVACGGAPLPRGLCLTSCCERTIIRAGAEERQRHKSRWNGGNGMKIRTRHV